MAGLNRNKPAIAILFCVGFLTGVLAAISVLTALVSYRLDTALKTITRMGVEIEEKDNQLQKLEKSINKGVYILKSIEVIFILDEVDDDVIDTTILENEVIKKLGQLVGKEVKTLDAEVIAEVVDKRIFRLGGKEYQLSLSKLILAENLKLWLEVEKIE